MENKVIKEIKKLKKDVSPRPEWVTLSRALLLRQINPGQEHQAVGIGFNGYWDLFNQLFRQRLLEPAVIMFLVLGVFLGSSLTINAAFYSLPGDNLYPLKIALEKTHVALISSQEKQVELKIEFAEKRMAEFNKIVQQVNSPAEKKRKIEAVVKEFKNNVVAVNDQLNRIKQADGSVNNAEREKTLRIAVTVSSKTEELAKSFDEKVESLSAVEKLEVEGIVAEAVASAQQTNLSAQQLAADVNKSIAETAEESGVVEGAETEALPTVTASTSTSSGLSSETTTPQTLI